MGHGVDRRIIAQKVIHEHVNQGRAKESELLWHFVQVIYHKGTGKNTWFAVVRVEGLNQKLFLVEFDGNQSSGEVKVDTFVRDLSSQFYPEPAA